MSIRYRLARVLGWVAGLVLVFMMFFTTYAVVSREFFNAPVLGVVDIMELSLVTCVFVAIAGVFLRDEHITVDVIDQLVPLRVQIALRLLASFLTLALFVSMLVEMLPAALEKFGSGEVTMTLSFDRFFHWIPILFCFFVAIGALVWVAWEQLSGADTGEKLPHE